MKKVITMSLFWSSIAFSGPGTLVPVSTDQVFMPRGFDDNDEVEIVLEGKLDNDCYRLSSPRVEVNPKTKTIFVQPQANYYPWMCREVFIPWTQTVPVGHLNSGSWNVQIGSKTESNQLLVQEAKIQSPDDFVYAPVRTLQIHTYEGKTIATLQGVFTSDCSEIARVKVQDSGRTIEILPIMKERDNSPCTVKSRPFEVKVTLPEKNPGRYLVHVRTLNGQAINQVFEVVEP